VYLKQCTITEVYYHYTTPNSAADIIVSKVIRKSTKAVKAKDRDDARYGSGVYLTQIPPTTSKFLIAFNNYDGRTEDAVIRMIATGEHR